MKHTYLTVDSIKAALTHHSITPKEAEELIKVLSRCDKVSHTRPTAQKRVSLSA